MAVENKHPRLVRTGDVVKIKGRQTTEVVRGVTIVVHLANGLDDVYEDDDTVYVVPQSELPVNEAQVTEAVSESAKALKQMEEENRAEEERAHKPTETTEENGGTDSAAT